MNANVSPDAGQLRGLRVCMLTSAHPAADDRIFYKEARSLSRHGADVCIVCPASKPLPTHTDGVRFRTFRNRNTYLQRVLGTRRLAEDAGGEHYDVVHCHEPDALVAALQLKQTTGARVIYDSHESWGGIVADRLPRPLRNLADRAFKSWESRLIRRCDAAIGATWPITDFLRASLSEGPVATILNTPIPEVFGDVAPRHWTDTTIVCHEGHLGFERGLKTIVKAIELVARRHNAVLRIVGDVFGEARAWLDEYVASRGIQNLIQRTGWLPYEAVGRHIAECHIGIIAFQDSFNHRISLPNKLFNYLLYGLPFIAPEGAMTYARVVQEDRCGVLANSASPEAYAAAITAMVDQRESTEQMALRATAASNAKYQWRHMEEKLLCLYSRVLER